MDIVVANGFVMERCTFFSREYHCCVLHNTRCKCEDYNPRNSKPITNADRIRAMSDEELAEWLSSFCACGEYEDTCPAIHCKGCGGADCSVPWLDWLRQEVENAETRQS